ncbi:MAG: hypothetical protein M1824_000744 [Vezdaea acicularis]|nr:MAG: hypothetical protein M1824_000744 [Vezdaea acicularis]
MPRNEQLTSKHQISTLKHHHVHGPFSFLNPTRAQVELSQEPLSDDSQGDHPSEHTKDERELPNAKAHFLWRSRDNRKGRHTVLIEHSDDPKNSHNISYSPTATLRQVFLGILRMLTQYPYWDVSYLVATIFTLGSVVWCINAFFVWLPLVRPSSEFSTELTLGGPITAFIGATIFEFGSILLMLEAVNENSSACFGWALESVWEDWHDGRGRKLRLRARRNDCRHHHGNKNNFVGQGAEVQYTKDEEVRAAEKPSQTPPRSWKWVPTSHELRSYYIYELGFLASLAQMFGATVFWISGFTALPKVVNQQNQGLLNGVFWAPQVVGGTGFIVSGILFMLETQPKWYIPAPKTLGWHVAVWNLIGGIGFTVSSLSMSPRVKADS